MVFSKTRMVCMKVVNIVGKCSGLAKLILLVLLVFIAFAKWMPKAQSFDMGLGHPFEVELIPPTDVGGYTPPVTEWDEDDPEAELDAMV